jgi:penicillin amidase
MQGATGFLAEALGAMGLRKWLLNRSVPPRQETQHVGCLKPISIRIDTWGVPHIQAEEEPDLFFAQGYCHARDRLWQMEVSRRLARGELAELFGERAVDLDRFLRRLNFRRGAEAEENQLSKEAGAALTAYVAGANAYMEKHPLPVEFLLLHTRPEPWRATDSLAFARYMGWMLTANAETELVRARLTAVLGPERAAALELREPFPLSTAEAGERSSGTFANDSPAPGMGGGSNNWVVSAARSATGRSLLANDPHLRPRMPCTWYVAHLQGAGFDVIGATMPGTIGVLIGHNADVAWGVTASMVDGQDLFEEQADPQNPHRFRGPDGWYDGEVHREEIRVKGQETPVIETIVRTRHGPLLNGTLDIPADGPPIALASITDGKVSPVEAMFALNRASDWTSFRAALKNWTYPALNFVYADVSGTIAYKLAGDVPVRASGDGTVPASGADGAHDWVGRVPFDDLPEAVNPPEGLWATANSDPAAPCKHFLARDFVDDNRYRRILALLRDRPTHSLADFQAMQADTVSLPAREVVQRLGPLLTDPKFTVGGISTAERELLTALASWDGQVTADRVQPSIYHVFRHQLLERQCTDLPEDLRPFVLGRGISEVLSCDSVFHIHGSSLFLARLDRLLAKPEGPSVIGEVLAETFRWLRTHHGPTPAGWAWGKLHTVRFDHVVGRGIPILDRLLHLSRGPVPIGGDQDTIAQSGIDPWHPFAAATFTVSYRQLFDVGNWDAAQFILPTGQSGHPGSPHYADMLERWSRSEYLPLHFSPEAVAAATAETIELRPAN